MRIRELEERKAEVVELIKEVEVVKEVVDEVEMMRRLDDFGR